MQNFIIEQFLPCNLSEVNRKSYRKMLPSYDSPLFINKKLFAVPMSQGYFIECGGQYFIESIQLLKSINGKSANELCRSETDFNELEEYYYFGIIDFKENSGAKVETVKVEKKYFDLYENTDTTWFSYIPQKIELDLTHKCNFICKHCGRDSSPFRKDGEMTLQNYVDFVDKAGQLGVSALSFMGGEPTCHPELIDLAIVAKFSGIHNLSTSTNGWLIDKKLAKKMVDVFGSIQISIHGALPTTHDNIVGRSGAFNKALNAIKLFKENNVRSLNISFTVMKENFHEMSSMVEIVKNLGVNQLRFLILSPQGRGRNLDQFTKSEVAKISETIKELRDNNLNEVEVQAGGFPPYCKIQNSATFYGCPAGRTLLYLNPDSIFKPCEGVEFSSGKFSDEVDLMSIWHSSVMVKLRKKPLCNCPYNSICTGGCLGNEYWKNMFFN